MSEDLKGLIRRLEQNLVAAPADTDLRERLANAHDRVGDKRAAGGQLKEIARWHLKRMRLPDAVDALKRAAERLPDDFRVLEQLYDIHRLAENEEAMVQVGVLLADKLRKARQTDRAESILMRCLQVSDEPYEARRVLMETYAASGRPDKAVPHAKLLAEHHPEERERKKFARLATELASQPIRQLTPKPGSRMARVPSEPTPAAPAAGQRWGWVVAGVAVAVVAGSGIWRHVGAGGRLDAVREATALAAGGDLGGAATRLRAAGLTSLADQADRTAASVQELSELDALDAAERRGLAGLPAIRKLAESGTPAAKQRAAAVLTRLAPLGETASQLRAALADGNAPLAWDAWKMLRDGGHLRGLAAADPELAGRSLQVRIVTHPAGASIRAGAETLGTSPLDVEFPIVGGRTLHLQSGRLGATLDCADAPGAEWTVPLQRQLRWTAATDGPVAGLAATEALILAATRTRELFALDRAGGAQRWRVPLGPGGDATGPPVLAGDTVVVPAGDGRLRAVLIAGTAGGPLDGRPYTAAPVAVTADTGVYGEPDGTLRLLATGGLGAVVGRVPAVRWLSADGDTLYAVTATEITALDWAARRERWTAKPGGRLAGPARAAGNWLVVPVAAGGVLVTDRRGNRQPSEGWARRASGAVVNGASSLFLGSSDGGLLVLVPSAGVARPERNGIPADLGGIVGLLRRPRETIYATTREGWLAAWMPPESGTATDPWQIRLNGRATTPPLAAGDLVVAGTTAGVAAVDGGR